jgi:iron complex outermembrane receptor protein
MNARAGFGIQTDIGLRGSTFSQVLILIDNQRLNDGLTGHFNNNIPVPLSEIAQIEIVKGPSGVSYGADAVGGVIHIKTKTYVAEPRIKINFAGKASKGQYGLNNNDLGVFVNMRKWAFSAGLKSLNADGQEFANPNYIQPGGPDSTYNTFFDQKNYTLSGTYFRDKWKIYLRGAMDMRDFNAKYFYTASSLDESTERIKAYWTQSAAIYKTDKQQTEFNIGYKHNRDTFVFNPLFTPNGHVTTRLNSTVTQNRAFGKVKLAYGAQFDHTTIESNDRGDHSNFSIAAFVLSKFKLTDKFLIVAGGRVENDNHYGTYAVPQLTATYVMPKLIIRSSLGQSVRNADFTERFVSYNIDTLTPNRNAGNPDVAPEKSLSLDLNLDWKPTDKLRINQSVFHRSSNNLIDFALTNSNQIENLNNLVPNSTYFYAQNIEESNTLGYELGVQYQLFNTDSTRLSFNLDYTWLQTTNSDSVVSKYIANHPIHSVAPRILLRYKRFRLSTTANIITRNPEKIESIMGEIKDQYVLVNARLSFKPPIVPARIFIEGRNLLDTQYQEILGARMPARWFYGGFIWRWGEKSI